MERNKGAEAMKRIISLIQGLTQKIKSLEETQTELVFSKDKVETLHERVIRLERTVSKIGKSSNVDDNNIKSKLKPKNALIEEFIEEQELEEESYNASEFVDTDMNIDDDDRRQNNGSIWDSSVWDSAGNDDHGHTNGYEDDSTKQNSDDERDESQYNFSDTSFVETLDVADIKRSIKAKDLNQKPKMRSKKGAREPEGPLECTQCNKRFENREHAKQHLEVHTGIKPYKCSLCEYESYKVYNVTVNHFTNQHGRRANKDEIVTNESDKQRQNDLVTIELNKMLSNAKEKQ